MPNAFDVLGAVALPAGVCAALDAGALAAHGLGGIDAEGPLLAPLSPGGVLARVGAPTAVVAVRRRGGARTEVHDEVLLAAAPGSDVPVAPLVETGLMGAMPERGVDPLPLALASGWLALVAPSPGGSHAPAHVVRVTPGAYSVTLARMPLPRGASVLAWIVARVASAPRALT